VTNVAAGAIAAARAGDADETTNTAVASETATAITRDGLMAYPSLSLKLTATPATGLPR